MHRLSGSTAGATDFGTVCSVAVVADSFTVDVDAAVGVGLAVGDVVDAVRTSAPSTTFGTTVEVGRSRLG